MSDRDFVIFKINAVPFKPQHFAAAETVKRSHSYQQTEIMIFCHFKKFADFFNIVVVRKIFSFLGAVYLVGGIKVDQIHFHGIFQSLMNICVLMNNRVCFDRIQLMKIM